MKRPVCYTTGCCMKPGETACPIKARVDANFWAGRPSTEWSTQLLRQTETVGGRADGFKITEHVDAIQSTDGTPEECMTFGGLHADVVLLDEDLSTQTTEGPIR